ncbi:hypothetical protein QC334_34085 [Streptomyces sp. DH18]|uniref:hypothetical protein n=1 Tax=Streptomyces sp. DH18 TaxID=3040126 RepID=UPI002442C96A|nr:hypothetical protein [Streptomyces sp. DH18]MDG9687701.1 hypothetical protein [Streptomyces sp. DH18]
MSIRITNTFGTPHNVSELHPAHVTSCDAYRLPLVGTIVPGATPGYDDMVQMLMEEGHDTRPEGYGLIFLESEEFSATYFGSIEQIEQYQRENTDGKATFDVSQGITYAQWPHGKGWDDYLPRTFWNAQRRGAVADGVGLVTAFAHNEVPGAEVIVYEFEGKWLPDSNPTQMITYHCTACHKDTFYDSGHVHENTGPPSRRWAARQARQHIISAARHGVGGTNSACRPSNGEMLRAVNAAARDIHGTTGNALPDTDDAYCATHGPCSILRELRAGVRPPVYRG